MPDVKRGSHWINNFYVLAMTRPRLEPLTIWCQSGRLNLYKCICMYVICVKTSALHTRHTSVGLYTYMYLCSYIRDRIWFYCMCVCVCMRAHICLRVYVCARTSASMMSVSQYILCMAVFSQCVCVLIMYIHASLFWFCCCCWGWGGVIITLFSVVLLLLLLFILLLLFLFLLLFFWGVGGVCACFYIMFYHYWIYVSI